MVYLVRKTLFVFVVALLFAYLLSPVVDLLDRLLPASRTRTPALALAYVLLLGALIGGGIVVGSRVVEQAHSLAVRLPDLMAKWDQPTAAPTSTLESLKQDIRQKIRESALDAANNLIASLPKAGMRFLTLASELVYVIIVPILGFFFLKDAREIRHHFLASIEDSPYRKLLQDLMADVHLLLAHYMRAIFILSLATLICYSAVLGILGMPYALLLGVIAAALEFIPMVGPLTAAAVILAVAIISGGPVVAVLIFLGIYRLFQDYVLSPYVMGAGVEMHPLLVLFGVFAGAEIAGIPGAFLSVPVLALLRILYRRIRREPVSIHLRPASSL